MRVKKGTDRAPGGVLARTPEPERGELTYIAPIMRSSWVVRHRNAVLLVLLLAAYTFQSFAISAQTGGFVSDVVLTALELAMFFIVFERRSERLALAIVFVAAAAVGLSRYLAPASLESGRALSFDVLHAIFLWAAVVVILRELFRRKGVAADNVLGAICGYLIAGAGWASLNEIAFWFDPTTFSINPDLQTLVADWQGRLALFLYYSLAQMMTVGYADVTPLRAPATTLSLFAPLFGLFYTAVVVAQFVGLAQYGSRNDRTEG